MPPVRYSTAGPANWYPWTVWMWCIQMYYHFRKNYWTEVPPPTNLIHVRGIDALRREFTAVARAKYLRTFHGDPQCDAVALQQQIDQHFPVITKRPLTWFEWVSGWIQPNSQFMRLYRLESEYADRLQTYRTTAMTPLPKPVDWNENILPVYQIRPTDPQERKFKELQLHLSTLRALFDYYGDAKGFTDLHKWESRKRMMYLSLIGNPHGDPIGNVTLWYEPLAREFVYRMHEGHCQSMPKEAHLVMAIEYVLMYRCRDFFIDDKEFPFLRTGYSNPCRAYKDDSVTLVDKCIPVCEHLQLTDAGPVLTPGQGTVGRERRLLQMDFEQRLMAQPSLLDECMNTGKTPTELMQTHETQMMLSGSRSVRAPTTAMILYQRHAKEQQLREILPEGLRTCVVGRSRPLPEDATRTVEERLIAFDAHHRDAMDRVNRRLMDYVAPLAVIPEHAASRTTLQRKQRILSEFKEILCNKFRRHALQQHQYEEFPIVTKPLAIGWRTHDPSNEKYYQIGKAAIEAAAVRNYIVRDLGNRLEAYQQRQQPPPTDDEPLIPAWLFAPSSTPKKQRSPGLPAWMQAEINSQTDPTFHSYNQSLHVHTKFRLRNHFTNSEETKDRRSSVTPISEETKHSILQRSLQLGTNPLRATSFHG